MAVGSMDMMPFHMMPVPVHVLSILKSPSRPGAATFPKRKPA
jgi:hypothetical protein